MPAPSPPIGPAALGPAGPAERWKAVGPAGSGRTALLVGRAAALVEAGAAQVLVVGASRLAVRQLQDRLVSGGAPGAEALTGAQLALRLARLADPRLRLAPSWARSAAIQRLVASEGAREWPTLHPWRDRPAFAAALGTALAARPRLAATDELLLARAEQAGSGDRWREVLGFAARLDADLACHGLVDEVGAIRRAATVLEREPEVGRALAVLVDDAHRAGPALSALLDMVGVLGAAGHPGRGGPWWRSRFTHGDVVTLPGGGEPSRALVTCGHPAVEGEAVVGVLNAARDEGVAWSEMAVGVTGADTAATVAAALDRHGVPSAAYLSLPRREPVVRAALDVVAWAAGDESAGLRLTRSLLGRLGPTGLDLLRAEVSRELGDDPGCADPAAVADALWRFGFASLAGRAAPGRAPAWEDRAVDVAVALLGGMRERAADPSWRMAQERAWLDGRVDGSDRPLRGVRSPPSGVTVAAVDELAGARWQAVVVAGAVEGRLPRVASPQPFLSAGVPEVDLAGETARFEAAVDAARGAVTAVAATGPGVLVSRYVAGWERVPAALTTPSASLPPRAARTRGAEPVFPEGRLVLSASQLATFESCPLRYAYQYPLGARPRPGVWADVGTLIHAVLAQFHRGHDRTWEAVEWCLDDQWTDAIAPYAPQREEIRRDTTDLLRRWWEREWSPDTTPAPPAIVAVEHPFTVDAGGHTVVGRIDRIDRVDGGLMVIDYKTGARLPPAGDVVDDIQLSLYHLAVSRDPDLGALGPPVALRLRYLRAGVDLAQPITDDHEGRTEARVAAAAERILAEAFDPSPLGDCDTCPFQRLCPLHEPGRPVVPA